MKAFLFGVIIVLSGIVVLLIWLKYCQWKMRFDRGYEMKEHRHDYGANGICIRCGREDPLRYPPMPPTTPTRAKTGRKRG